MKSHVKEVDTLEAVMEEEGLYENSGIGALFGQYLEAEPEGVDWAENFDQNSVKMLFKHCQGGSLSKTEAFSI